MKSDHSLYFDCDGVILDSNEIKSTAFFDVALEFTDESTAHEFMMYHQKNGGISRFKKFEYLFSSMLKQTSFEPDLEKALKRYGQTVLEKLLVCPMIPGIENFLRDLKDQRKYVISGGKQVELEEVFKARGLSLYFEGIYGSPRDKFQLLTDLGLSRGVKNDGTYFGDSRLDFEAATEFGLDFVFISGKSEFSAWKDYFKDKSIRIAHDFNELKAKSFVS